MRFVSTVLLLLTSAFAWSADSVRVPANGGSQFISAFGLCATVTNSKTLDQFISVKSYSAWNSFLIGPVAGVSISLLPCSCFARRRSGDTTSGIYSVDTDGPGPLSAVSVYCDMVTDGGGWTLIGRSAPGGSGSIGWGVQAGSVSNDTSPYSLNVTSTGLTFTELLFGSYTSGKTWGSFVYKHSEIPKNFITAFSSTILWKGDPTEIVGNGTAFGMGRNIGMTSKTNHFFFRDIPNDDVYGINPDHWFTFGNLSNLQGMLMVR